MMTRPCSPECPKQTRRRPPLAAACPWQFLPGPLFFCCHTIYPATANPLSAPTLSSRAPPVEQRYTAAWVGACGWGQQRSRGYHQLKQHAKRVRAVCGTKPQNAPSSSTSLTRSDSFCFTLRRDTRRCALVSSRASTPCCPPARLFSRTLPSRRFLLQRGRAAGGTPGDVWSRDAAEGEQAAGGGWCGPPSPAPHFSPFTPRTWPAAVPAPPLAL